jgi:hypothetical protein
MFKVLKVGFGLAALSLTFGAVQFASGSDLVVAAALSDVGVNRSAKADRIGSPNSISQTRTISVRSNNLEDTSIAVRLPRPATFQSYYSPNTTSENAGRKRAIACEPVVSTLTEVAKHLQPGRCLT